MIRTGGDALEPEHVSVHHPTNSSPEGGKPEGKMQERFEFQPCNR